MTAELLRRAAKEMRERADALNGDRWIWLGPWMAAESRRCTCGGGGEFPHEPYCGLEPIERFDGNPALGQHVASWHPAVALAVADLLDDEATRVEKHNRAADFSFGKAAPDFYRQPRTPFLAVARAYLGEATS